MTDRDEARIVRDWPPETEAPLVSVCCIAYNHAPFIESALAGF